MILKKIYVENLRSYENQEITFPKGSTLLSGDIGSGKTTVLLAIEFALFGLQPSQKATSLLRAGEDSGKVILEFEIEGKQITIERTLKRGKKSVTQDYNSLVIDSEKFEGSVTEIKSRILKLLNYPSEFAKKTNLLYKFTVYTPQEEMKQIILESGDTRLNTLRHVFGIDKYKRIEENAVLLASRLRERIRINEGMIYDLENNKEKLIQKKNELGELKNKQKSVSGDYKRAIEFRKQKEEAINEIEQKINEKRSLETEREKSKILISEKNQQVRTIEGGINTLAIQIDEAKKISFNQEEYLSLEQRIKFQEERESELQSEYIQVIGSIKSEQSKKLETESLKNKIYHLEKCPTCLQEVSFQYRENISKRTEEELQSIHKRLSELNMKKNQISERAEAVKKTKEAFKDKKSELELLKIKLENLREKESRVEEMEKQKHSVINDLEILKKHLSVLEESITAYSVYDSIFKDRTLELEQAKLSENKAAIKNAEINKEIQFLEQQIKEKNLEIEKKESLKKKTERVREIEYWVSNKFMELVLFTEKQVMITLREEFSKLFSNWFSILVSDTLSAKLDDDFSPLIEQQDYELDYSFLSGGERTAVALAYRLALNQVINSLLSNIKTRDLVILDEPTDGFSAPQLDKMRDVLNQLNVKQLILVSHEQKIEGFVDNIIRVRKDLGVTKINC